ncbi:hypothetical protein V1522DRAFT_395482 [Lipomyces starkeyi]
MSTSKSTFNPLPAWSEPFCITPESRLRPGKVTWILDGTIVDDMPKEIPKGSTVWAELYSQFYWLQGEWNMHEVFPVSTPAVYGGQPNIILDVSIVNDTGSERRLFSGFLSHQLNHHCRSLEMIYGCF